MNPPYTYKNKFGTYYFRLQFSKERINQNGEIRFSLRTKNPGVARKRANLAWNRAQELISCTNFNLKTIQMKIQSSVLNGMFKTVEYININNEEHELVKIKALVGGLGTDFIQELLLQALDGGAEVFSRFGVGECEHYEIVDESYDDHQAIGAVPLDIETVTSEFVRLTDKCVRSATTSATGVLAVDEFYSYQRSYWSEEEGFKYKLTPVVRFEVRLSSLYLKQEDVDRLGFDNLVPSTKRSSTLSEEFRFYVDEAMQPPSPSWREKKKLENEGIFSTFIEVVGDKKLADVNRSDIRKFGIVMGDLPPNRNKREGFKGLSAREAADINREVDGKRMQPRTVKKYYERLNAAFNQFLEEKLIDRNYFSSRRYRTAIIQHNPMDAKAPFSREDLKAMFESEDGVRLFGMKKSQPCRAWGCLIALYTGARAEEIFSLPMSDVIYDTEHPFFSISESVSRVKNQPSIRKIPIHPKLIDLGFLEYLEKSAAIQECSEFPMLFPELKNDDKHGFRRGPTRWINNYFLPRICVKTKTKSFHSFRHNTIDVLRRSPNIHQLKASQYIGHKEKSGAFWQVGPYGSPFEPDELVEICDMISYELDFDLLKEKCLDVIKPRLARPRNGG